MGSVSPADPVASAVMAAALAVVLVVCSVSDLRSRTVPNRALLAGALVAAATLVLLDPALLPARGLWALGAAGFLLCPALLRPGSMGLGDVKLAGLLGLYLGGGVVTALLAAFLAGTLAGLLLLLRHGLAARKMAIPFVPYLALGAVIASA
jgi:leader peptidase (prepilin peptidase)/N-methyltransferase